MSVDWKIRRREARCGTCEAAFPEGARHASLLAVQGDELAREDLCVRCFESRSNAGELFYWFTRQNAAKRGLVLDLVLLEQLFVGLEGRGEKAVRELRYLVALLLMRKRRIKLLRVARGEQGESMIVRRPRRKESFEVFVFDFDATRMDELRHELTRLFDGAEPPAALVGADTGAAVAGEPGTEPVDSVAAAS